eukprot:CAMPEP_0180504678 /NCGR_PEP_ID=MMETSP1036_2-20121128/46882_1 /TAXON_ID=632150 /ORGANISM="Azadinium spinosum, Strain 3D9" /LENGTH=76 /DNA_ID=CAMNT_0022514165 /DNA_START=145 /DNA_END=372 /DNA_ORIENTATION=+
MRLSPKSVPPPLVFHEDYSIPWPEKHRFPMWKYQGLADYLVQEGDVVASRMDFARPHDEAPHEQTLLCHDAEYYWA